MSDIANTSPVLIVDDDPIVRSLMRATLEVDGYEIIEADDGEKACRLFEVHRPQLVVADVVMPHMDGFALCRELRRRPDGAYVPILMATGLDDVPSITKAYEAGATDFISKPINWVILGHRVRYMLRASRAFDELRLNQDRLVAAKDAAETASRAKTEFLANMGHELRTPLNAIIGFSTMMREGTYGPLDGKYLEYATAIADSGSHLLTVINGILDMARAESNRMVLVEEEVEIARAVAFSLGTIEEMAQRAGIDCRCELPDDLPRFFGDAAKLRQILINLISNAVKFTPAGGEVGSPSSANPTMVSPSAWPIPGSASPMTSCRSPSPRSARSMAALTAGTMASASACRSPSGWSNCTAARWKSPANRGKAPR